MSLKFREDSDLNVLALARHEDLKRLADVLTLDAADGAKRRAQELLDDAAYKVALKTGNLAPAWRSIAAELQTWGGDTVANVVRGLFKDHSGVQYREIVRDLCEHVKLKVRADESIVALEDQLLIELVRSQQENFSREQMTQILEATARGIGLQECLDKDLSFDELARRSASDPELAYILASVVPAIASVALPVLARLSATTALAAIAPRVGAALAPGIGLLAAASTLSILTSPAYRVTLPAVLEVARIRRKVVFQGQFSDEQKVSA